VIAAGYPALMRQFILSNPGLSSRFTRSITFDDYTAPEMCRIFANMCKKEEYTLPKETLAHACVLFYLAHSQRDEHFGNARFVRNVYENTTMKQSARLAAEPQVTKQALATLEHTDIPFEMIPNFDVNGLDLSQSRWSGTCPGCQKEIKAKLDFIGQKVTCKQCGEKFLFPWWNPVPATIAGVFPSEVQE
jgi:DNA-directed RNA polymerase subunit RPC12/RpoP